MRCPSARPPRPPPTHPRSGRSDPSLPSLRHPAPSPGNIGQKQTTGPQQPSPGHRRGPDTAATYNSARRADSPVDPRHASRPCTMPELTERAGGGAGHVNVPVLVDIADDEVGRVAQRRVGLHLLVVSDDVRRRHVELHLSPTGLVLAAPFQDPGRHGLAGPAGSPPATPRHGCLAALKYPLGRRQASMSRPTLWEGLASELSDDRTDVAAERWWLLRPLGRATVDTGRSNTRPGSARCLSRRSTVAVGAAAAQLGAEISPAASL